MVATKETGKAKLDNLNKCFSFFQLLSKTALEFLKQNDPEKTSGEKLVRLMQVRIYRLVTVEHSHLWLTSVNLSSIIILQNTVKHSF